MKPTPKQQLRRHNLRLLAPLTCHSKGYFSSITKKWLWP
jgi:hypothetical protein